MNTPRLPSTVQKCALVICLAGLFGFGGQVNPPASDQQLVAGEDARAELSATPAGDASFIDSCVDGRIVYTARILDTHGGPAAFGWAVNNNEQVVGERETAEGGSYQAAIWNGGYATRWQTLAAPPSVAFDINDKGYVVGIALLKGKARPVVWRGNKPIDLGTLGGSGGAAYGINERGQIVGNSATPGDQEGHATLWQHGKVIDLGTLPGGLYSSAKGINDAGDAVGSSRAAGSNADFATLWKNGKIYNLGTVGGIQSYAEEINDSGQIVGWNEFDNGNTRALLWEHGKGRDLGTLGGAYGQAFAINRAGYIVGISSNSRNENRATLWYGSHVIDINSLLAPGTKVSTIFNARDINDRGEILAVGDTPVGARWLLLIPKRRD